MRVQRIQPSSCVPSGSQRGRPNRVSSIPSTATGSGSASSATPRATTARCTVGHDTPCAAATSDWSRPSSTAPASAARSRVVVRIPAGTWATCSVNDARGHPSLRQRQRRLRHNTCASSPPQGSSRGRVSTQSFPEVDTAPHAGQRAASGSSVTSCTIFTPDGASTTRSTANPAKPNKHDASSLRSTTARGSPLAAPEHSEDHRVAGRPRSGAPHELKPQVARSRSKSPYTPRRPRRTRTSCQAARQIPRTETTTGHGGVLAKGLTPPLTIGPRVLTGGGRLPPCPRSCGRRSSARIDNTIDWRIN